MDLQNPHANLSRRLEGKRKNARARKILFLALLVVGSRRRNSPNYVK
jgi:hypothetical protein